MRGPKAPDLPPFIVGATIEEDEEDPTGEPTKQSSKWATDSPPPSTTVEEGRESLTIDEQLPFFIFLNLKAIKGFDKTGFLATIWVFMGMICAVGNTG